MQCQMAPKVDTDIDWAKFEKDLSSLINMASIENGSDTPDFILAEYLGDCLRAWNVWGPTLPYTYREMIVALGSAIDSAQEKREKWFGTPSDTDGGPQN